MPVRPAIVDTGSPYGLSSMCEPFRRYRLLLLPFAGECRRSSVFHGLAFSDNWESDAQPARPSPAGFLVCGLPLIP